MLASFNNGHTATVQALLADSRVEVNLQDNVSHLAIPSGVLLSGCDMLLMLLLGMAA